jgi:GH15 family glucan-1,4-alpha-glucosidase
MIREYIESDFVMDGHFIKHSGSTRVDSSLAWAALPHHAYTSDNPIVNKTLNAIKRDLQSDGGGVKRYLGDTYYGGGDWVLLEALLAWNQAANGDLEAFENAIAWMRSVADTNLDLPEQVLNNVQTPEMIKPWEDRWGTNAKPLLWSHAMYLLLLNEGIRNQWI